MAGLYCGHMEEVPSETARNEAHRGSDGLACLLIVAFFLAWHAAGVFAGQVYVAEDTAAYFFSNRAVHYALAQAGEFGFWDPLPGLGQPRLANIQNGSFAPLSLLFYALPTTTVFRFYPALVLSLLSLSTFAFFRLRGGGTWPALFGALSWSTTGALLTHVQHLAVIETLLFLPVTLLFWQLALRRGQGRWAILAGLGLAAQCFGASAQYLVYNGLLMALFMGSDLFAARQDRSVLGQRAAFAVGVGVIGLGLASWQLLPFLEMVQHSHRGLLNDPGQFSGLFRAAPLEVLRALGAEIFAFQPGPVLAHGAPYRNQPQLSLLTLLLATMAFWRRPRPWAMALGAGFFLLGMLGSEGGVTSIIQRLFPFADRLRAPYRMIVPAAFLLSWMATLGLERLRKMEISWRGPLTALCIVWVAGVGWFLKRPLDQYVSPSVYNVPQMVASLEGRMVADFIRSERMPHFAVNSGLAAGVPTLLMREVLIPRNFFEAYFVGQHGSMSNHAKVDRTIVAAALPFENPDAPIWRAFGLTHVVRFRAGRFESERRLDALDRFSLIPEVQVEGESAPFYARLASPDWDPSRVALLRQHGAALDFPSSQPGEARIRVLRDETDRQVLEVESTGGVLVTSGLFFPGWRVEVDGQPAEALEVNAALRGVALSPGRHVAEWSYRPTWLVWALVGSGLAGAFASALVVSDWRRARTRA